MDFATNVMLKEFEVWIYTGNGDRICSKIRPIDFFDCYRDYGVESFNAIYLNSLLAKRILQNMEPKNIVWQNRLRMNNQLYIDGNKFQELLGVLYAYGWVEQNRQGMIRVTEKGMMDYKQGIISLQNDKIDKISNSQKKILISHSFKDKQYCELLVSFLEDIGLTAEEVICTSVTGYGIRLNDDIYEWLASQFDNELYVVFVLSEHYYNSPACLNEMGAAWVLKKEYSTILLPGFELAAIEGAINPRKIAMKLDSPDDEIRLKLNDLKNIIAERFELDIKRNTEAMWNRTQNKFITGLHSIR